MTPSVATTYLRPGADLVLRVQDDTAATGPDATLLIGTAAHVAQFIDAQVRGPRGQRAGLDATVTRDVDYESAQMRMTVQRWDQSLGRWRRMTTSETRKFDDIHVDEVSLSEVPE